MSFYEETEKLYANGQPHELDVRLHLALQDAGTSASELNQIRHEASRAFIRDTAEGRKLSEWADGDDAKIRMVLNRVGEIYHQRYGDKPMFIFELRDVAADLLNSGEFRIEPKTFSPPPTPEPTESERIEALIPEVAADVGDPMRGIAGRLSTTEIKSRCDRDRFYRAAFQQFMQDDVHGTRQETRTDLPNSEIKRFGYLLSNHIQHFGVPKPAAGFYTLKTLDGKEYKYPIAEYQRLSEVAARFNLF